MTIFICRDKMKRTPEKRLKNIPQKEKKFARTKIALLNALISAMGKKSFAEIKIKDLCLTAEISEPTFYNYFTEKNHLSIPICFQYRFDSRRRNRRHSANGDGNSN